MLYAVGSRINLKDSSLDDAHITSEPVRDVHDKYESGTKISFLKMAQGMILMSVNEPPMCLSIATTR
jgi:hypothetical protein